MSIFGFVAIFLGFFAIPVAFTQPTRPKVAFLAFLYLVHVAASVVYYFRAVEALSDSYMYYYDTWGNYQDGFGLGTQAIIYVTQSLRSVVGGTYLDYFLLYQVTGFLGIAILLRMFEEIHDELGIRHTPYLYALVAIPSLHFWSSALGKDAPFLLAVSLALWASMRLPSRAKALFGALLLMLLIRPHVALVAVGALSLSVMVGRGIPLYLRVGLFLIGAVGTGVAVSALQSTYAVDVTSSESIGQQFERRDQVLQSDDAGNSAVNASFPIRLLSLMFRPFFFDAKEPFALIASFESLFLVYLVLVLVLRVRDVTSLFKNVFFARYALIFGAGMTIFLALAYWNVGLGLRQKWSMLMPMYLVTFVTVIAMRLAKKKTMASAAGVAPLSYPSGLARPVT